MACENCDPKTNYPGRIIKTDSTHTYCSECGEALRFQGMSSIHKKNYGGWDDYFHTICEAVASKSSCLSRHIGAILVKDHSIVSTGYNGPSRGIPHCGEERIIKDKTLHRSQDIAMNGTDPVFSLIDSDWYDKCPRKILGYESGTHMELCPAVHAEANAIIDAGRKGASTIGTTLYMNCIIPCKACYGLLINAGIVEIVIDDITVYDKYTQYLIDNSKIKIRRFEV